MSGLLKYEKIIAEIGRWNVEAALAAHKLYCLQYQRAEILEDAKDLNMADDTLAGCNWLLDRMKNLLMNPGTHCRKEP